MNHSSTPSRPTAQKGLTLPPLSATRQAEQSALPFRPIRPASMVSQARPIPRAAMVRSHAPPRMRPGLEIKTLANPASSQPTTPQSQLPALDGQTNAQAIETAFTKYGERLQADFRDFRVLCTKLIVQEQQDKEKWHSLCLKMMQERDMARQKVQVLLRERETRTTPPPTNTSEEATSPSSPTSRLKRLREVNEEAVTRNTPRLSPSRSPEPRATKSLRASPFYSPTSPSHRPLTPPDSATSSSFPGSSSPLQPAATSPRAMNLPPIASVIPPRDPGDTTAFDVYSSTYRPQKRRKSCESWDNTSIASNSGRVPVLGAEDADKDHTSKPLSKSTTHQDHPATLDFSHVDIMYVPLKGRLICRACLLEQKTSPTLIPKSFPTNATWDDLRIHCVSEHPDACGDVTRLHPAELFELRKRLNAPGS